MLLYLTDTLDGGETAFPALNLTVKPKRGDALVFRNLDETGLCHPSSQHLSNPVRRGTKMVMQRWYCSQSLDGRTPPKKGNCGERHVVNGAVERTGRVAVCDGVDCRSYVRFRGS